MPNRREFLTGGMAASFAVRLRAQDQAATAALSQPEFEVASVKANTSLGTGMSIQFKPGGSLWTTNISLRMLITFAYNIRDHQITGAPHWTETDRWDIAARPSAEAAAAEPSTPSDAAAERRRLRLRSLLASRFQLVAHKETREMPIYLLVVGKGGHHMELAKPDEPGPQIMGNRGAITCKKVSMKLVAENLLSPRMGRSVVDKTGLTGDYDFEMKYVEEGPSGPGPDSETRPTDQTGPNFTSALEEQLGLKLESGKGPVEIIAIDKVERASEN